MKQQTEKAAKEVKSVAEAKKKIAEKLHSLPIKTKPQGPSIGC
ncbi:hypothetical protein [Oleiphilus messinensis]|nr:hypothetical protein [Oleiphilus messinensis]